MTKKETIYVLGNQSFEADSLPIKVLEKLKEEFPDINFEHFDPTEEFPKTKHLVLIDTIINSNSVSILRDIEKIEDSPKFSLHDLDLGMSLKLAKKMGNIDDVTIIGIPPHEDEQKIISELRDIIKNL